jgi:hypothetical protein
MIVDNNNEYHNERIMNGVNQGLEHHAQLKQILHAAIAAGHHEILLYHNDSDNAGTLTATQVNEHSDRDHVSLFAEQITYASTFHGTATVDFGFPQGPTKTGDSSQFMECEGNEIVSWSMAPWLQEQIV